FVADLSSQEAVRGVADALRAAYPALHVLVNNAGVVNLRYAETADGIETVFAVNHLAPFLLTHLLLGRLAAGGPARIVNVASDVRPPRRLAGGRGRQRPLLRRLPGSALVAGVVRREARAAAVGGERQDDGAGGVNQAVAWRATSATHSLAGRGARVMPAQRRRTRRPMAASRSRPASGGPRAVCRHPSTRNVSRLRSAQWNSSGC